MKIIALIVALLSFIAPMPSVADDSATELYRKAIDAMRDLPQPSYVSYRLASSSEGYEIGFLVLKDGSVWLRFMKGTTPQHWTMQHRTYDYETEIVDNDNNGKRYVSARSFFDPTWYGAYRALHQGILYTQDQAPPHSIAPTPTPPPELKTIAVESVMGEGVYHVADKGATTCSNGDAGRALHLWSVKNTGAHQLSDAIVDLANMRFCMIRYEPNNAFAFEGIIEQHYADVGGYWMQTDGLIDGTNRFMGIATHRGIWRYKLLDMTFSNEIPDSVFRQ